MRERNRILDSAANCAFLLAAAYLVIFGVVGLVRMLLTPAPGPWEAQQMFDAWRFAHGMRVYEEGRAVHMYGPLVAPLFGSVMRVFGTNILYLRLTVLAFTLFTWAVCLRFARQSATTVILMLALLLAADEFGLSYSVRVYPEMIAIAFALAGLLCASRDKYIPAAILIVLAFLMKQPAAMAALIPPIAVKKGPTFSRSHLRTFAPLAAVLATALAIKLTAPPMWHALIEVPSQFKLLPHQFLHWPLVVVQLLLPLFVVAAFQWKQNGRLEANRWFVGAVVITVPACIFVASKIGGTTNSFLPALIASALLTADIAKRLKPSSPLLLALALALPAAYSKAYTSAGLRSPDRHDYHEVASYIKTLKGRITAPEDPTLVFGRDETPSVFVELDAHPVNRTWSTELPQRTLNDLNRADWVVDVLGTFGDPINPERLQRLGFCPYAEFPHHVIWRRSRCSI